MEADNRYKQTWWLADESHWVSIPGEEDNGLYRVSPVSNNSRYFQRDSAQFYPIILWFDGAIWLARHFNIYKKQKLKEPKTQNGACLQDCVRGAVSLFSVSL